MYIIVNSAYTKDDKYSEDDNVYFGPFATRMEAVKWANAEYKHWDGG